MTTMKNVIRASGIPLGIVLNALNIVHTALEGNHQKVTDVNRVLKFNPNITARKLKNENVETFSQYY